MNCDNCMQECNEAQYEKCQRESRRREQKRQDSLWRAARKQYDNQA